MVEFGASQERRVAQQVIRATGSSDLSHGSCAGADSQWAQEVSEMARRRAIGIAVSAARIVGLVMVILALISLPPLRTLIGKMAVPISFVASVMLGLVGLVWLAGVELFLRFFDQFLSRN